MAHILIGVIISAWLLLLIGLTRKRKLQVKWWQWLLTVICFVYIAFVLEVIVSFLEEGAVKGALVMGTMLGFIAIIWGFLLGRTIFTRKAK